MRPSWHDRIVVRPEVLAGKPIVKGTRLSVDFVVGLLAQGWSEVQVLENYPGLCADDLQACRACATASTARGMKLPEA